jgi:hypothetical protein
MKDLQHSSSVEVEVIRSLQSTLQPSLDLNTASDYIKGDINPNTYSSALAFKKDYAYLSFLRKWKGLKVKGINPKSNALATWLKSEMQCFNTNRRLSSESMTHNFSVTPSIIVIAKRKVDQILGPVNIESIAELCRFGKGATYDLRRGSTHSEKSRRPSVTFDAIPMACRLLAGDRYLASLVGPFRNLKIVRANRMVMVPKNAKTDRPIAAEPTLNSYIQQGIGRYMRQRLKRFGVDLGDQTINQGLARRAQFDGFSTIDLSSASDTLCINLVKLLLPPKWFEMLDSVRCAFTEYRKRNYYLSKFSSMGNAFTFELESLIFYALCSAVAQHDVSVYGDDLIVDNRDCQSVLEVLSWAGFTVNDDKSYFAGSRFYESCGKHYFDAEEVTPCYQKDVCRGPHDYVRLHNRLVRAGIRLNLREEFQVAAKLVRERSRRVFGTRSPGTGPLVEYDEYFIKEGYVWASPNTDSVRVRSAVTISKVQKTEDRRDNLAYFARKLRSPAFLNPAPDGACSESAGSKLLITEKYHWRSATLSVALG